MVLVCHIILLEYRIKGSYDVIGKNLLMYVTILQKFVAIGTLEIEIFLNFFY